MQKKITAYLLRSLQMQCFITAVSIPILVAWGLPISLLSPLGNIVFTPFILLFLLLASCIFFLELLHIPNGILILCLEKITALWSMLIHYGSQSWLIGFIVPSLLILLVLPIIPLLIEYNHRLRTIKLRIAALMIIMLSIGFIWYYRSTSHDLMLAIACNKGQLTALRLNNETTLIDPGYLGQSATAENFAEYRLQQELYKGLGTSSLDHVVICKPTLMTFRAIATLCSYCRIKNIYIPYWQGTAEKKLLRAYGACKKAWEKQKTIIHRIGRKPITIHDALLLQSSANKKQYKEIEFNETQIEFEYAAKKVALKTI